ncbi:hypothetical protein TcG_07571 [Trypanosoma cruzi]|nr:hypothetical protein TcG_07571 [Trypanosoma cruzi]
MCLRRCGEAAAVSLSVAQKKTIRATAGELPTVPHFSERWRKTNGAARKKWPHAFEYAAALRPSDHPAESRAHASTKSAGTASCRGHRQRPVLHEPLPRVLHRGRKGSRL